MSDIPEDVMKAATDALDRVWTFPDGTYPRESYDIIANAILAERERCERIARIRTVLADPDFDDPYDGYEMGSRSCARSIANEIENGK